MRKRLFCCLGILMLAISMLPIAGSANEDEKGIVVDFGHYLGRDSVPGEHKEEAEAQKTGANQHSGAAFTDSGMNQGSLFKQSALLGYDIYRVSLAPTFHNAATFVFVYDKNHKQGWVTFNRQSGAAGYYYQGGTYPLNLHNTKRLTEEETKKWKQLFENKFPKIMDEDLTNSGLDGMTVTGEYILNGHYEKVYVWCPNHEYNPVFIEIIDQLMQPFEEQCKDLQQYLY